ncbi:serine/threonine-protein phosphatase 2A 55 kDa regulatory subunit B delta isoform [Bubalus kerabau]|uniref:serine/threonine-protein phosphatase 2A 55 kDa regulatory subunit B delta isoform n=1 Tax=Bubalus carabanensis TaxID=3119969 RepID=UPI00244E8A63|nr:serine/threonine-protein phosphatase 2A 55 kDa regulatory subunit B delta isoform [Bubalus carabanensis]
MKELTEVVTVAEPDPFQCCEPIYSGSRPPPGPRARPQRRLTPSRAACSSTAEADPLQGRVLVHSGSRPPPGQRACPQRRLTPSRAACSSTVEADLLQGSVPVYGSSTEPSAPATHGPSPRTARTPRRRPDGPYNNSFWMFDRSTRRIETLEASRVNSKPRASLQPHRV